MNFFNFDIRRAIVLITALIIPFVLIKLSENSKETPLVLRPFTFATGVMQNTYSAFSSGVRNTTSLYLNLVGISKENRELTKENEKLKAQLGGLTELKFENERLNTLLKFKQKTNMQLLAAKVIGQDLIAERGTMTINRGTAHGVHGGMAVITVGGVVGYILRPEVFTSQIILITDRDIAIDAIIQRTRARGIVSGKDDESCTLNYLKRGDEVQEGDLIVTSGLDSIFPKGFPVGSVTRVEKSQYGISQYVELKPTINPGHLEEIFVVLNAYNEDFEKVTETAPEKTSEPGKSEPKVVEQKESSH